jgi:hypothetical protein
MTRMLLAMLLGVLVLPPATRGQSHPDFSGTWTMDVQRSVSPTYPEFGGAVTLVIKQSDTAITIETKRGARSATVTYLPGKPASTPASGIDPPGPESPPSRYYWEGAKLVTETVRLASDAPEGTFRTREVRTLNSSGTEMTVETMLVVEHGYNLKGTKNHETGKDVYTKSGT